MMGFRFDTSTDEQIQNWLAEQGFIVSRKLEDGSWIGIMRLAFTWAVCSDISEFTAYRYRWCFENQTEALIFFAEMKDFDDVPNLRKSLKGHRYSDRPLLMLYDEKGFPRW